MQGAAGTETSYGDPLAAALAWQEAGAQWIHLVDLDAAFGRGSNAPQLADVVARLDVAVELSGGIRDDASLAAALATGCARVTSAPRRWSARTGCAASSPSMATGSPSGSTCAGTKLAARGWTTEGGELDEALDRLDGDGCARYVVTDIDKDGMLTGPNLDLLRRVCARTARPSSPAAACPAWPTCGPSPRLPRWGWRARSSARPCMQGRSPWRRAGGGGSVTRKISSGDPMGAGRRLQPGGGSRRLRLRVGLHLRRRRRVRARGDAGAQTTQAIANVADALERLGARA